LNHEFCIALLTLGISAAYFMTFSSYFAVAGITDVRNNVASNCVLSECAFVCCSGWPLTLKTRKSPGIQEWSGKSQAKCVLVYYREYCWSLLKNTVVIVVTVYMSIAVRNNMHLVLYRYCCEGRYSVNIHLKCLEKSGKSQGL